MKPIFFICLSLVITYSIVEFFQNLGEDPTPLVEKTPVLLGRYTKNKKLTGDNIKNNKPIKKIALFEEIPADSVHRIWPSYEKTAQMALKKFKEIPRSYEPEIVYYNEIFLKDARVPALKIKQADKDGCLIGVGFSWSTAAGEATEQANKSQLPYISPTAVLNNVHNSTWSLSLGVNIKKSVSALKEFLIGKKLGQVIVIEDPSKIYEREYAEHIRNIIPNTTTLNYTITPDTKFFKRLSELLKKNTANVIVIPGYTSLLPMVRKIFNDFPETTFIVGPQWSHNFNAVVIEFNNTKINLYCISDMISTNLSSAAAKYVYSGFKKPGQEIRGGFQYSLFDAITLALHALDDPKIKTKADALNNMKNIGLHPFAVKSPMKIKSGEVTKPLYLMRWVNDLFIEEKKYVL